MFYCAQQGGIAVFILNIRLGFGVQQQPYRLLAAITAGIPQGITSMPVAIIDAGAALDQLTRHFQLAVLYRQQRWRCAILGA